MIMDRSHLYLILDETSFVHGNTTVRNTKKVVLIVPPFVPANKRELLARHQLSNGKYMPSPAKQAWILNNLKNHVFTHEHVEVGEVRDFLNDNCKGHWAVAPRDSDRDRVLYAFEKENDAIFFKLRFI